MNRNKVLPLAALLGVVIVLGVALLVLTGRQTDTEEDTGIALCAFSVDAVTAVSYQDGAAQASLTKAQSGEWTLDGDPMLPLDGGKVETMLVAFTGLVAERELGEEAEVSAMGFAEPNMTVTLTAGAQTLSLTVGNVNEMTDTYYVQDDATGAVYTVNQDALSGVCRTPMQLYKAQPVTEITPENVVAMTVDTGSGPMRFIRTEDTWSLSDDAAYALNQELVTRMARTICEMQTGWTVTAPQEGAYGLERPNVTVTLETAEGTRLQCEFGNEDPSDANLTYLRSSAQPDLVYEVATAQLSAFAYDKAALQAATPETADNKAE